MNKNILPLALGACVVGETVLLDQRHDTLVASQPHVELEITSPAVTTDSPLSAGGGGTAYGIGTYGVGPYG